MTKQNHLSKDTTATFKYDEKKDVKEWVEKHGHVIYAKNAKYLPTIPKSFLHK